MANSIYFSLHSKFDICSFHSHSIWICATFLPRRAYRVAKQHIEPQVISSDTKWHISMLKLLFAKTNSSFDCVTSLPQKRVVKVNFCLFCAKNVLGLGVEFFPLFQDGLLVVVVVDGIGPKLCFQAKTATLGVVGFAKLSAKKVSAVKLYAGHIGVAIQRDTRLD